ncbi:hypothetical protein BDN70DRAFT_479982 [Pholiota conissans]|uniref:Uncharacterized protein n=1 Tax=Pholiota conissans TaxID=109636 RepID=A0A9P5Z8B7_9AGAR|nr:hypothetical protein BDN70DRAFT_479982 [Pholiota conissans]
MERKRAGQRVNEGRGSSILAHPIILSSFARPLFPRPPPRSASLSSLAHLLARPSAPRSPSPTRSLAHPPALSRSSYPHTFTHSSLAGPLIARRCLAVLFHPRKRYRERTGEQERAIDNGWTRAGLHPRPPVIGCPSSSTRSPWPSSSTSLIVRPRRLIQHASIIVRFSFVHACRCHSTVVVDLRHAWHCCDGLRVRWSSATACRQSSAAEYRPSPAHRPLLDEGTKEVREVRAKGRQKHLSSLAHPPRSLCARLPRRSLVQPPDLVTHSGVTPSAPPAPTAPSPSARTSPSV